MIGYEVDELLLQYELRGNLSAPGLKFGERQWPDWFSSLVVRRLFFFARRSISAQKVARNSLTRISPGLGLDFGRGCGCRLLVNVGVDCRFKLLLATHGGRQFLRTSFLRLTY